MADHYREPLTTRLAGYRFRAVVIGPREIPALTDPGQVLQCPELGMLSVAAHGHNPDVLAAYKSALTGLPPDYAPKYLERTYAISPRKIAELLEALMTSSTDWPVYSPFAKEHFGKGKAEGKAEEARELLLAILADKFGDVPVDIRQRIESCEDLSLVTDWVVKAAKSASLHEVFRADD